MSTDPRSRLLHATRPPKGSPLKNVLDIANLNYQTIGTAASLIGAIETALAAAAGSKVSLASRASIYLLPIAAFQFGTWLRERSDAKDQQRKDFFDSTRRLIVTLAVAHAIELHLAKHPRSVLRDDSSILGLRLVDGRHSTQQWTAIYKGWWKVVGQELDTLNSSGSNGTFGSSLGTQYLAKLAKIEGWGVNYSMQQSADQELWKAYVMSRFDRISSTFTDLLARAERGI